MNLTERLLEHFKSGRPLSEMSAKQTFGITDVRGALWNLRIKGYRFKEVKRQTVDKYTGKPVVVKEFWLIEESGNE